MNIAEFARWAIENGPFAGCELDGADVQEKAVACGLLLPTRYDPKIHGGSDCAEPGDNWYVFSPDFKSALKQS